jgi:hypothetical protein
MDTTFDVKIVPLGNVRLRLVELIYALIKLGKPTILSAIAQSSILQKLSQLLEQYPWNNFMQLKMIALFEEIMDHCEDVEFRKNALVGSNIGATLINLAKISDYEHDSKRPIRHGYMAAVIKIAAAINKYKDKPEVKEYVESLGDDWKSFIEGEFKRSTDINNKNLGDQRPRSSIDDEDDNNYEMNMDKIMAKFSNFNSGMASKSNEEEEEEQEAQKNDEDFAHEKDEDDEDFKKDFMADLD